MKINKNTNTYIRKREPKDQRIAIRLSASDLERVNRLSAEEDLPVSQIIRKAVKIYENYYKP